MIEDVPVWTYQQGSFTHVMVLSVRVQTATFTQRDTLVVAEHISRVTLAALHTGGRREVAGAGEEVGAGWGTGVGTV